MGPEKTRGLALGGAALLAGACAPVFDLPVLGLAAGAAGLAAGLVVARLAGRAADAEQASAAAETQRRNTEAALATATGRVTELEALLAEPPPPAPPAPDNENVLTDPETGLPGEAFFAISLDSRVAAARRHLRPVAVVLLEVADRSGIPADATDIATQLQATLRQADTVCRLEGSTRFGLVLEDTPENGAVWSVERFRRALATSGPAHILRAGIACYPAHAFDTGELRQRATDALSAALQWRQDRIEVATSTDV